MGRVRFETEGAKSDTRNIIFGEFGMNVWVHEMFGYDGTYGYDESILKKLYVTRLVPCRCTVLTKILLYHFKEKNIKYIINYHYLND